MVTATIIAGVAAAVAALVSLLKTMWPFKSLRYDEEGIRSRLGNPTALKSTPTVYRPGRPVFVIPAFHTLDRIRVLDTLIDGPERTVRLVDNTIFRVAISIQYRITDTFKAIFFIRGQGENFLQNAVLALAYDMLLSLMAEQNHEEAKPNSIKEQLSNCLAPELGKWGIGLSRVIFPTFEPDGETITVLMSKTRAAMVKQLGDTEGFTRAEGLAATGCSVILGNPVYAPINGHSHSNGNGNGNGHSGNGHAEAIAH